MKKYLAALTVTVCMTTFPTFSQTPGGSLANSGCSLTPAHSPEIRGIRLGMSTDQLLGAFPEESNRNSIKRAVEGSRQADTFGVGRFDLRPDGVAANPKLSGLDYISIEILDERVTRFLVSYKGPEWKTVDQFVAKLSEAFRLPSADAWYQTSEKTRSLKCDGFTLEVAALNSEGGNFVAARNTSTHLIVEARREATKEKERRAFQP